MSCSSNQNEKKILKFEGTPNIIEFKCTNYITTNDPDRRPRFYKETEWFIGFFPNGSIRASYIGKNGGVGEFKFNVFEFSNPKRMNTKRFKTDVFFSILFENDEKERCVIQKFIIPDDGIDKKPQLLTTTFLEKRKFEEYFKS